MSATAMSAASIAVGIHLNTDGPEPFVNPVLSTDDGPFVAIDIAPGCSIYSRDVAALRALAVAATEAASRLGDELAKLPSETVEVQS